MVVEVESVAYIVCDAIGLDSGDSSFAYVARWASGDVEKIKEIGQRVVGCAKDIVSALSADDEGLKGAGIRLTQPLGR